jgi:hypothetical protein
VTPSAPEPAQAEPEVKATEANRRNEVGLFSNFFIALVADRHNVAQASEKLLSISSPICSLHSVSPCPQRHPLQVIKLAPMMASMPAGAKPAAAPKKLNPAQVQAAERQRLEQQGAQVSSSGMRKMDLTELMQQVNIGGLSAGPAAVGAPLTPSPASAEVAAPAPLLPAMNAMQPPPSTVPAPAPAMNELFPSREDDEEDELQRQLDMHPAGKALRATMVCNGSWAVGGRHGVVLEEE